MDWKKAARQLLFPPLAVRIILIPLAAVLLIGSMVFIGKNTPIAIVSYVLSAYTLTVWCLQVPNIIQFFKRVKTENRYVQLWLGSAHLRSSITLYGASVWNVIYALFQLWLGFYHRTFWFASLGVYYLCLAAMRGYLVSYLRKNRPGKQPEPEWKCYRVCGWVFLVLNTALAVIIFFMVYWNRTFAHHMITAITMAAYTFTAFTVAIINLVKYRKYHSPVLSAGKAVGMASACVSMLTLEATMLTTFNDGSVTPAARRILLGATGAAVSAFVLTMAVYMIVKSTRSLRELKEGEIVNGKQR